MLAQKEINLSNGDSFILRLFSKYKEPGLWLDIATCDSYEGRSSGVAVEDIKDLDMIIYELSKIREQMNNA